MDADTPSHDLRSALRARRSLIIAAVITVVLDVGVKLATVNWLVDDPVELGPLTLKLVHNEGVAFGLGQSVPTWGLLLLTGGVTVVLAVLAWRGVLLPQFAAGMIVAGAACNAIDRAIGGSVVDTFALSFFPPVFNVADAALDVGLVIVFIAMLFPERSTPDPVPDEAGPNEAGPNEAGPDDAGRGDSELDDPVRGGRRQG
ncbi:MAG: signal peptidase II [Microthrixaceae bacterium]